MSSTLLAVPTDLFSVLNPVQSEGLKMTSLEVADVTGKQHKNVIRDIKTLIRQKAITRLNFELSKYSDTTGRKLPMYKLDFHATLTLVTGYNAVLRSKVIARWIELEKGETIPSVEKRQGTVEKERTERKRYLAHFRGEQIVLQEIPERQMLVAPEELPALIADPASVFLLQSKQLLQEIALAALARITVHPSDAWCLFQGKQSPRESVKNPLAVKTESSESEQYYRITTTTELAKETGLSYNQSLKILNRMVAEGKADVVKPKQATHPYTFHLYEKPKHRKPGWNMKEKKKIGIARVANSTGKQ